MKDQEGGELDIDCCWLSTAGPTRHLSVSRQPYLVQKSRKHPRTGLKTSSKRMAQGLPGGEACELPPSLELLPQHLLLPSIPVQNYELPQSRKCQQESTSAHVLPSTFPKSAL